MANNKINQKDLNEWEEFIKTLDKNSDTEIEFEEALEEFDSIEKFSNDKITFREEKNYRLNLKTLNYKPKNRNKMHIDATLDLHGQSIQNAHASFLAFIESCYTGNKRNLLIITGKGKNSPGGVGAIKNEFKSWVKKDMIADKVINYTYAKNKDGGDGAFYVFLKKQK